MTTSASAARQSFAVRLQASLGQQGHVLGGAAGSQALWQQYGAVADHAVAGWTTGHLLDPALGRTLPVERDEAVGLAGDLVLAVEGAETNLFEDHVSIGVSRPAVAVSTNDAVLVHSVDPRGRVAQTVVPYAAVLSAEPVVVAVGPPRPGLQLVYLDEIGEDQVVVLGVAGFSAADGAARETIRDAFLARVVDKAHQQGAPLGDDDEDEDDDTEPGWVPGPAAVPGWGGQQPPHASGRNAGLVAGLVVAVVLVLALAGTLAFVLLRDPGLEPGRCLTFEVLQTQDDTVDCDSPRAFYRVQLVVPDRPAGDVGDLTPCPADSAFAWWADDEDRLFSADAPPFNALADGRLVCVGLVG